ncbi:translation initiation factor [Ophiostoma piceae UAMH 11346]|uniref:Translation initiation factor n=1 Tax=Ophiostoma piceae (strain UAMH 11346) TaxID=1262450 RepID=S3CKE2_OPHP1|nr:translation initiation factor [Ophiostoma piceae UAMH 11346]
MLLPINAVGMVSSYSCVFNVQRLWLSQLAKLAPVEIATLATSGSSLALSRRQESLLTHPTHGSRALVSPITEKGYEYLPSTFFPHLLLPLIFHKSTLNQASQPMSIENLKTVDPFAEAEDVHREQIHREDHIHIRIQQRNGRKTLTTVQGIPSKFSQKKILHVVKKKFACNGTTVHDGDLGDVIQLQGDQRKHMQAFLTDKKSGLELDPTSIKIHGF